MKRPSQNYLAMLAATLVMMPVLALLALDFGLVMAIVYVATVPDLLSPIVALIIGFFLAILVCVVFISGQGSTVLEFVVPAFILLCLLLILYPVAVRVSKQRHARSQKIEQQRALK